MIYTSSYQNSKSSTIQTYSISKDKGRDANYHGDYYLPLAPTENFFRIWRNNRGQIDEMENNAYYMREFYNQILKPKNPKEIYELLDNSILLCYEDSNQFCHRHIVAAWLELTLGIEVCEVTINQDTIEIKDKPKYIKEYLENMMIEEKSKVLQK